MKLKKVLMILIALAVVLTMAGVVSAEEDNKQPINLNTKSGYTDVTYKVDDAYEVIIPVAVSIGSGLYAHHDVNVTKALIEQNKYLHVNLSSTQYEDGFKLKATSGNYWSFIPYNITYEGTINEIANHDTVLTVEAGHQHPGMGNPVGGSGIGDVVTLNFSTTETYIKMATLSGDHTDTLTFQFWVDEST